MQNLDVQPNQRDHQAECAEPFHVFGRALVRTVFDEIKIQHEVERGDHHDECAEANAHEAGAVDAQDAERGGDGCGGVVFA